MSRAPPFPFLCSAEDGVCTMFVDERERLRSPDKTSSMYGKSLTKYSLKLRLFQIGYDFVFLLNNEVISHEKY